VYRRELRDSKLTFSLPDFELGPRAGAAKAHYAKRPSPRPLWNIPEHGSNIGHRNGLNFPPPCLVPRITSPHFGLLLYQTCSHPMIVAMTCVAGTEFRCLRRCPDIYVFGDCGEDRDTLLAETIVRVCRLFKVYLSCEKAFDCVAGFRGDDDKSLVGMGGASSLCACLRSRAVTVAMSSKSFGWSSLTAVKRRKPIRSWASQEGF
jgi:hypothetical protein